MADKTPTDESQATLTPTQYDVAQRSGALGPADAADRTRRADRCRGPAGAVFDTMELQNDPSFEARGIGADEITHLKSEGVL
jgi:hypothetical protein